MHSDRNANGKHLQWNPPAIVSAPCGESSNIDISHVNLQWSPPEFLSAPGGPPSNVAISNVNPCGRTTFMGNIGDDDFGRVNDVVLNLEMPSSRKVVDDDFGNDLVLRMNLERVQTRVVEIEKRKMLDEEVLHCS
ncbi:hypothetical protein J5N97_016743 [Dioscorea zingiberensis]|uniref:Uncharacterized protein n=1 Tax=Dioscorea zingiberensis TaxID=325984 RepID=A0A9D5HFY1_9LILI|nr:hypothetical protein J5N97_016743 [Dioscorea zingiberensis]